MTDFLAMLHDIAANSWTACKAELEGTLTDELPIQEDFLDPYVPTLCTFPWHVWTGLFEIWTGVAMDRTTDNACGGMTCPCTVRAVAEHAVEALSVFDGMQAMTTEEWIRHMQIQHAPAFTPNPEESPMDWAYSIGSGIWFWRMAWLLGKPAPVELYEEIKEIAERQYAEFSLEELMGLADFALFMACLTAEWEEDAEARSAAFGIIRDAAHAVVRTAWSANRGILARRVADRRYDLLSPTQVERLQQAASQFN